MARIKYTDDLPGKIDEYTQGYYEVLKHTIPSYAGLCEWLGIGKSTIYEWRNEHEPIAEALARLLARQERLLSDGGLSGQYNAAITKLILSNNHGYSDKATLEHGGSLHIDSTDTDTARRIAFALNQAAIDQSDEPVTH